jgi:hypothetical protein
MSDEQEVARLAFSVLPGRFAIARLETTSPIPTWALGREFFSVTRTPEELSIVAPEKAVPARVRAARGWRVLKLDGPFEFSAVGVLAAVTGPLAEAGISLFAIATFDTDYVLVKEENLESAVDALERAGHRRHDRSGPARR